MADTRDLIGLIEEQYPLYKEYDKWHARAEEEFHHEDGKRWYKVYNPIHKLINKMLMEIGGELVAYFEEEGIGIRSENVPKGGRDETLLEIYLGSDDGVKRFQSKVSVYISYFYPHIKSSPHILPSTTGLKASLKLRSEKLEDINFDLSKKEFAIDTIQAIMDIVDEYMEQGFWD